MRHVSSFLRVTWAILFLAFTAIASAQATVDLSKPQIELITPVFHYPPLARQARITGDVLVKIGIRPDGSTVSAEVISGHPMLKQAALDSAQKSTFSCYACHDPVTYFSMTYTFGIRTDASPHGCDNWKTRSRKCFYLWRCGKWEQAPLSEPAIGQTLDRIIILGPAGCLNTQSSQ